jgi:phosphoribosyl 1,2-cyclic phosphodiesterase
MKVTLWGTRGSVAAPGPETTRYGGNTSCVQVEGHEGTMLVLDAGTGIRRLGASLSRNLRRVDVLLTHLHMDHLQGLGFFAPLYDANMRVHIWGPASITQSLRTRLTRYLSPPLFPVHLRDLVCKLQLHEVPFGEYEVGEFHIRPGLVCHPGPTVGYRVSTSRAVLAYIPDHEPALGGKKLPQEPDWLSGYSIAEGADLLIHDAQYNADEYAGRVGWGHSSVFDAYDFGRIAGVKHFVPFHHDPGHTDADLDDLFAKSIAKARPPFRVTPGIEGAVFELGSDRAEPKQVCAGDGQPRKP